MIFDFNFFSFRLKKKQKKKKKKKKTRATADPLGRQQQRDAGPHLGRSDAGIDRPGQPRPSSADHVTLFDPLASAISPLNSAVDDCAATCARP